MSLVLAAWLLGPPGVAAEPAAEPALEEEDITRVVVLLPRPRDRRIDDVVASARADLPTDEVALVEVAFDPADTLGSRVDAARRAAREHDARGVFWFDLAGESEYLVYLYLPARDVTLRRRVPEASQSVEAAVEAMWIILRSGTVSIARGVAVEMERVDPATIEAREAAPKAAPPRAPEPAPAPSPRADDARLGLWFSASYYGLGLGPTMMWQSGGGLELSYAVHRWVKLGLAYGIVGGMPIRDPAELAILRHELAAVVAGGGLVGERIGIEGRLLPALELLQWRAGQSDTGGVRPAGKLAAELMLRIVLVPRVTLDFAAGADVSWSEFAFVLCGEGASSCRGDARVTVLAPWRVRPRARVGVSVVF